MNYSRQRAEKNEGGQNIIDTSLLSLVSAKLNISPADNVKGALAPTNHKQENEERLKHLTQVASNQFHTLHDGAIEDCAKDVELVEGTERLAVAKEKEAKRVLDDTPIRIPQGSAEWTFGERFLYLGSLFLLFGVMGWTLWNVSNYLLAQTQSRVMAFAAAGPVLVGPVLIKILIAWIPNLKVRKVVLGAIGLMGVAALVLFVIGILVAHTSGVDFGMADFGQSRDHAVLLQIGSMICIEQSIGPLLLEVAWGIGRAKRNLVKNSDYPEVKGKYEEAARQLAHAKAEKNRLRTKQMGYASMEEAWIAQCRAEFFRQEAVIQEKAQVEMELATLQQKLAEDREQKYRSLVERLNALNGRGHASQNGVSQRTI